MPREIVIDYAPRPLQLAIHNALEKYLRGVAVCHRRFGKTVLAVNHLQKAALICRKPRPRFAYVAPTFTQGKSIAWDYMKHYASVVPNHKVNESELRIDFENDAQIRIYGADNPDRLRGLYFDGVVLDEYGLMPPRIFSEVVSPTLIDRQGWAFFIGTPNGKNQFYRVINGDPDSGFVGAREAKDWFFVEYKASTTDILPAAYLAKEREQMTPDEYDQEYECSFDASVKGAIYARELMDARQDGRITRVPYDPSKLVDTDWDLGFGDTTAVWFSQKFHSGAIHLIDYYEAKGEGLPHFISVLKSKNYAYGSHWAPWDIQQLEISGNSRIAAAHELGLHFNISPKVDRVEDRIHSVKLMIPRCYFDADKCREGLETLHNYRWKVPKVLDPTGRQLPVHDWASHGSDAFGGLAYRDYESRKNPERLAAAELRKAQADPGEKFRWQTTKASRGGY